MSHRFFSAILVAALAGAALFSSCGPGMGGREIPEYQKYLYMTDTNSGKVYAYNPEAPGDSTTSIAATSQNSSGEIVFHGGIGYMTVGFGSGEGVYYFNPAAINPAFAKLSGTLPAQYIGFYNATKAYVSSYGSGLYSFNPSTKGALVQIAGTAGLTLQDVIKGGDGFVYVADNGRAKVLKIAPATDTISATISSNNSGTTGLYAGNYNGNAGIFVANIGGSIDFVPYGAADNSTAELVTSSSIYPGRLVQLSNGNLVATGYDSSWINHSYLVTLAGPAASVQELLSGGASFGSLDVAYKDGLVYIPATTTSDYTTYTNKLYVLDESGAQLSYSPVSVMTAGDSVTNIAFFQ